MGRSVGDAGQAILGELDAIEAVTGARPRACAWAGFYDPDVIAVLRAYDWHESGQLAEWWGSDPPYWLVLGVAFYHRALSRVHAQSFKQAIKDPQPGPPKPGTHSIRR